MKIRELLFCALEPNPMATGTAPTMGNPTSQPTGPTTPSGMPSSQGGVQMAQNSAPAKILPNLLPDNTTNKINAADAIAYGPFGSQESLPTPSGDYFGSMVNRPPIPLK